MSGEGRCPKRAAGRVVKRSPGVEETVAYLFVQGQSVAA